MNLFAMSGLLIGALCSALGVLVFIKGRSWVHYTWGFFVFAVALWGFGAYRIATVLDPGKAVLWWRIAYIGVILIPIFFTHFVYKFLALSEKWLLKIIYPLGFLFLVTNFINGLFIDKVRFVFGQFYYISPPTILYNLFIIFFFGLIIYSHIKLLQAYKAAQGIIRTQIKYIFFATAIGFSGGTFAFLPVYKIDLYPILNIAITFAPMIVTYTIVKKKLFDIKVVLTTFFVGLIAILFALDIFIFTPDLLFKLYKALILVIFFYFGYLLIKSVLREIKYREEIAEAYEVEKKAREKLKRLNEAKNQFIMATQHHLRTPLTSMIGYLDLIFGGTYGKISPRIKETLRKFQVSTNRLIKVVNEFLDISQFQLGKKVITLQPDVQIGPIFEEIIEDLQLEANARGIYLKLQKQVKMPGIKADPEKLKMALYNIVDNGIKYTNKGGVTIKLKVENSRLRIIIKDTGAGISKEDQKVLFTRLFERGKEAKRLHGTGKGIGLYIAFHIIKAHKGKIWAESEGRGKGSTFYVELPIK